MSLKDEIVSEIMSLVRQQPTRMEPRPSIEELERILNSETTDDIRIEPDGSVSCRPTVTTVGAVAEKVLTLVGRWRNDAFENSAQIVERYFPEDGTSCCNDIRAMKRDPEARMTVE